MDAAGLLQFIAIYIGLTLYLLGAQSLSVGNMPTNAVAGPAAVLNNATTFLSINNTTMAATTTGPVKPTAMPTETPVLPNKQRWNVTNNGSVCILFELGIRMTFNYQNQTHNVTDAIVDVPINAVSDGLCGDTVQSLTLQFYTDWQLTVYFTRNVSTNFYHMSSLALHFAFHRGQLPFPHAQDFHNSSAWPLDGDSFVTSVGTSYICTSQQTMFENESLKSNLGLVRVNFYDTWLEAFRPANNTSPDFSPSGGRCSDDELSLLVPIIVGACLAGLIVIVLVAYFIGRQHSKRGYENV